MSTSIQNITHEYQNNAHLGGRFVENMRQQLEQLLKDALIYPAVPLEARLKTLESIIEKIERRNMKLKSIFELQDLVGFRITVLYRHDLSKACEAIESAFTILKSEDTSLRLKESQFGYQSLHYNVKLLEAWRQLPTFSSCDRFQAEIQVRTLSQHIWAVASHDLQYKREESVPRSMLRTIYRLSALLETVDLELERIILERDNYASGSSAEKEMEPLNVHTLTDVLNETLPKSNREENEAYSEILSDLLQHKITTAEELRGLIQSGLKKALEEDAAWVLQMRDVDFIKPARIKQGAWLSHHGLVRAMLHEKFGTTWQAK